MASSRMALCLWQNETLISPSTASYTAETPFSLKDISFTIFGSANTNVEAAEFTIDNGVKQKFTFSGQRYWMLRRRSSCARCYVVPARFTTCLPGLHPYKPLDWIAGSRR
jgi:hypothetical protein